MDPKIPTNRSLEYINGGSYERCPYIPSQLFHIFIPGAVQPDGQLQMPRGDPLHLQVLGSVAGQLKHLGGEVNTKTKIHLFQIRSGE